MGSDFVLTDVSSEAVMSVVKVASHSTSSISFSSIAIALTTRYKENYLKQVIIACLQLNLLEVQGHEYVVNSKYRDSIKKATKEQLGIFFRESLQNYSPFLMYADFISNRYSSKDSASMTKGIMKIKTGLSIIEKSLRVWGMNAKLIINEQGKFRIPEGEKGLPANYVKELLDALDSEFRTKMFLINVLSAEVFNYLNTLGMDISDLAKALVAYEVDPKQSMHKALDFFETFLHKFGTEIHAKVQGKNGVNALVNELFDSKKILKNQQHVGNGLGGCRNISAHGVDKDTQKEWNVTPQASLSTIIMVPVVIRSFYLFAKKQEQGF